MKVMLLRALPAALVLLRAAVAIQSLRTTSRA